MVSGPEEYLFGPKGCLSRSGPVGGHPEGRSERRTVEPLTRLGCGGYPGLPGSDGGDTLHHVWGESLGISAVRLDYIHSYQHFSARLRPF